MAIADVPVNILVCDCVSLLLVQQVSHDVTSYCQYVRHTSLGPCNQKSHKEMTCKREQACLCMAAAATSTSLLQLFLS